MIEQIREKLLKWGQQQLLIGIDQLSSDRLRQFLIQLEKYEGISLKQRDLLFHSPLRDFSRATPFSRHSSSGNQEDQKLGERLLREGKVGCLILAGGQGTRLGFDGPKGCIPVSPIRGKSLFQIFCERVKRASEWSGCALPLCMMTSPLNHLMTIRFFQHHHAFGLVPSQIEFFEQHMLPFIDDHGCWLLEEPGRIAEGPNGNGDALQLFFNNGLWNQWKARGIEYLNIIGVDNVLADPFDPELIGFAYRTQADVVLKAVERTSPDEKMGVIAEMEGKLKLIEYSEIPETSVPFTHSNTGLFCISMEWIRHLYEDLHVELSLHLARKSAKGLVGTAKGYIQEKVSVWKCEKFIFDLFDYAQKCEVLVYPREKIYAPLKNAKGEKSIETVKQALYSHYREMYRSITGSFPPAFEFELDSIFYYPTEEQKQALRELLLRDKTYVTAKESRR